MSPLNNEFLSPITNTPPPVDVIREEYDFYLEKLILVAYNGAEYDITNHLIQVRYYEDLFHVCSSGVIELLDAIDYPQLMPLLGQERIKMILARQDENSERLQGGFVSEKLEFNFRLYKIDKQELKNEKAQTYLLYFVSDEFIKNLKQKVYKTWKSRLYSDMVSEIFNEKIASGKSLIVEPTLYEMDFVASNWTPFEFFNIVASRSISSEGNGESYVFFENRDAFYYVTLGKLFSQGSTQKYTHVPHQVKLPDGSIRKDQDIQLDVINTQHYNWHSKHDVLKHLESGMYANFLTTIDPVRQKFEYYEFDLDKEWSSFKHLEKEKNFTSELDTLGSPKSHTKLMETNKDHDIIPWISGREPNIKPLKLEEYTQRRTSQMNQINQYRMGFRVSGDPRRKLGQIIEFDLPQVCGDVSDLRPQEMDKYFSGKYLVVSICHTLSQTAYSMEIEVMKESFSSGIEHINPIEKYSDIY